MLEAEDPCRVAIRELNLHRIVPHRIRALRRHLRLKHWQWRTRCAANVLHFFSLVVAKRARAIVAKIWKIEVAGMTVSPCDIHSLARGDPDLYVNRLFSRFEWNGHQGQFSAEIVIICWRRP